MNDEITFEEFVTIMSKQIDIAINIMDSVLQDLSVVNGNSKLKINIPSHMQGINGFIEDIKNIITRKHGTIREMKNNKMFRE